MFSSGIMTAHGASCPMRSLRKMNLESLANELFLDLFEFLTLNQLFYGFHGLNSRFDSLLHVYIQRHTNLDFQSVSKSNFDIICHERLPSIIDRIISLRLSNDDDTPQQIDLFFSHISTLDRFIRLRSFSLYHIHSAKTMIKLMNQWHHLPNLTHLKISKFRFGYNQMDSLSFINSIWSLPKLTHCHLDISEYGRSFIAPNRVSTSLEYLSIESPDCPFNELIRLFQHTPRLRCLLIDNTIIHSSDEQCSFPISSIIKLKISLRQSSVIMRSLLQNMPNLCHLTIETWKMLMNGDQWEELIVNHLPKLKVLRFKMGFELYGTKHSKQNEVNDLIDSFRTPFWLDHHQWFVRCDWDAKDTHRFIHVYTLPYISNSFPTYIVNMQSNSTSPYGENDHYSYNSVRSLFCHDGSLRGLALSHVRFLNLHHLSIRLPLLDHFWSVIPTLNKLTSLVVWMNDPLQLQILLDRAPYLHSLKLTAWPSQYVPLVMNTSQSIRRLDLQSSFPYFNQQQCAELSHSPLGRQCEALRIQVEKRTDILELVNNMINLRVLDVICLQDKSRHMHDTSPRTGDEFVTWLHRHLPPVFSITRDTHPQRFNNIKLWIR